MAGALLVGACDRKPAAPLTVSITKPAASSSVATLVTVAARIEGGKPPVTAVFRVDKTGTRLEVKDAPFIATLDLGEVAGNRAAIVVEARDSAGAKGQARVSVNINRALQESDALPSVRLLYPVGGSSVCGTLDVAATAADDAGIEKVRFFLDGALAHESTAPPYRWTWNTTSTAPGRHVLKAEAIDTSRRSALDAITVEVKRDNGCDNVPAVVLLQPAPDAVLRGKVDLIAQASDDVGVTGVQFFIDGSLLAEDNEVPFRTEWNTDEFAEGAHLLRAIARDTGGQLGKQELGVTIDRTAPVVDFVDLDDGAQLSGEVTIEVMASDRFGLHGVRLGAYRGGSVVRMIGAFSDPPFEFKWDTTDLPSGNYDLRAEARDRGGLVASVSRRVVLGLPLGEVCQLGADCQSGQCSDGVCCNSDCGSTCRSCTLAGSLGTCTTVQGAEDPGSCDGKSTCNGTGQCRRKRGESCAFAGECGTGFCVDGVCCDGTCTGTCRACNLMGSAGVCSPVRSRDDVGQCQGTSTCNDAGNCVRALGAYCTDNAACASGFCVDGVCCDKACTEACFACGQSGLAGQCAPSRAGVGDATCQAPNACDGAGNCRKAVGQACTVGSECALGFCVDGFCCDGACQRSCASCAVTGRQGTCSTLVGVADPDSCQGMCSSAGTCAARNGTDCTTNQACGSGNCVDGVCCDTPCRESCRSCNQPTSRGTCRVIVSAPDLDTCASPRSCDATGVCRAGSGQTCVGDTACLSGFCADGVCCDNRCDTPCMACNTTGKLGQCAPAARLTDDAPGCTGTKRCGDAGACKAANGQPCGGTGSECASGVCVGGRCCADETCPPGYGWTALYRNSTGTSRVKAIVATGGSDLIAAGHFQGRVNLDPQTTGMDWRMNSTVAGFVTRLDAQKRPVWSRVLGGSGTARVLAVAANSSAVYVAGSFSGGFIDFDPGTPLTGRTANAALDAFIVKLDSAGNYIASWFITGAVFSTTQAQVRGLAVAPDGSLLVVGDFSGSIDLDPGSGTQMLNEADGRSFVLKLTPAGERVWGHQLKAQPGTVTQVGVATDGAVVYGGTFGGTIDLDPTGGADPRTASGTSNVFVTKLGGADGSYLWSRVATGSGTQSAAATVLADGTVAMTGSYATGITFEGELQSSPPPSASGGFFVRYAASGQYLGRSMIGATEFAVPRTIAPSAADGVVIGGLFRGTADFDPGPGEVKRTKTSLYAAQVFMARYKVDGGLAWVVTSAGQGSDGSPSVAALADGAHVVGEHFNETFDFDSSPSPDLLSPANGDWNGFITRIVP